MPSQQTLQGNWNEIKGKLRNKWGQLTNDDVQTFNGNVDQLVGLIQRKTGEARTSIMSYLDELSADGASVAGRAAEEARQFVNQAGERFQEGTQYVSDSLREGYAEAEEMVRRRPAESAAVCFGAGLLVGLVLGLSLHRS